jgi:hypothetical protein
MKDFVLEASFLRSTVDLPMKVRKEIVSQLEVYSRNPRNRDLDLERLEGSNQLHALRMDSGQRIILRLDKSAASLLFVETEGSVYPRSRDQQPRVQERVIAPVEALETLLVQEKYLPLTRYLFRVDSKTREVEFRFSELEKIINAHLPPEARQFPNWWANQKSGRRAQAFAWMAAGWIVIKVDIKAGLVRLKNMKVEGAR